LIIGVVHPSKAEAGKGVLLGYMLY